MASTLATLLWPLLPTFGRPGLAISAESRLFWGAVLWGGSASDPQAWTEGSLLDMHFTFQSQWFCFLLLLVPTAQIKQSSLLQAGGNPARHLIQTGWRLLHTSKAMHPQCSLHAELCTNETYWWSWNRDAHSSTKVLGFEFQRLL